MTSSRRSSRASSWSRPRSGCSSPGTSPPRASTCICQCHELIHFDIPWSLIRIEQRNGRIDRYGQRHRPQITTLLLEPDTDSFSGDIRVLSRLLEKEREAHTALGDVASLMGKYDVAAEEEEIRKVLAGEQSLEEAVGSLDDVAAKDPIAAMLARISALHPTAPPVTPPAWTPPARTGGR